MGIHGMYTHGVAVLRMSIGHTLLGLLESGPRHGYDLKRAFDERFGHDRPLAYGQVYSTMARLLKNGLVEVDGIEPGGGPERKRYAITDAGITDVERVAAQPEKPEPYLQTTLYTKVVLALLTGRAGGRPAGHPARRAPAADARADPPQDRRRPRRPADLRPRPVPPGGGPAVAGAHRRPARPARRGGGPDDRGAPAAGRTAYARPTAPPRRWTARTSPSAPARSSP